VAHKGCVGALGVVAGLLRVWWLTGGEMAH
jgi:hypothetical protein